MGLALLATKDKGRLVTKLTKKAAASVDSYADISAVDTTPLQDAAGIAATNAPNADHVSQTLYIQVLFPHCP